MLGAKAALAVGNDTGPLHLVAAAGAPTVVLFSSASDPALSAPRGQVAVLQADKLADLPVAQSGAGRRRSAPGRHGRGLIARGPLDHILSRDDRSAAARAGVLR